MYTCASCAALSCNVANRQGLPKNCPIRAENTISNAFTEYSLPENKNTFIASSEIEAIGYCEWTRLREVIELCKRLNYAKIGMAFCLGLKNEARIIDKVLKSNGFEVVSVICKAGGISKELANISEEYKLEPDEFEPMCNPIGQAFLLNEQQTQFNIAVGLCVGHDSLFFKYSNSFVTTLIAKDRVLANNPAGAVYCAEGYYNKKLFPDSQSK